MTRRATIFAPASGHGMAGIAVIRVSGPAAALVLERLTRQPAPEPRRAALRTLRDAAGEELDRALVLCFEAGASYTGEPVAELHCHGGRAVVMAVLDALSGQPECRLAEPGEFTRRAFEAGRMDLAEIEALGDLLAAETELQRRQAIRGLNGGLHRQVEQWRLDLVRAAALIEVTIDWVDEEVPVDVASDVAALVAGVRGAIERELTLSAGAEQMRTGLEVALVGAPNAGKSSLLNTLAGREAAITSPLAGTTRDVLELRYDLDGLPVVFLDMAGLRDAGDDIERIGVDRAKARADAAALRLFLCSVDAPPAEAGLWRPGDLRVWTKCDLGREPPGALVDLAISARTGDGVGALLGRVSAELSGRVPDAGLIGHLRQRRALEAADGALARSTNAVVKGQAELAAEELRSAFRDLERLLGHVGVENVLDEVFWRFCLGK